MSRIGRPPPIRLPQAPAHQLRGLGRAARERGAHHHAADPQLHPRLQRRHGRGAAVPIPASYKTFNEFFTRALQAGRAARSPTPTWSARWTAPSASSAASTSTQIFQAKGHAYTTHGAAWAATRRSPSRSATASFATLYLSPKDYHRIHMPCDGRLTRMIHVPGRPVLGQPGHRAAACRGCSRATSAWCACSRARAARSSLALVGATIVGSMADGVARRGQPAARRGSGASGATTTRTSC